MPATVSGMPNADVPGGTIPAEPTNLRALPIIQDGALLGAVWVTTEPVPDGANAGGTTHLADMPPRVAVLAQMAAALADAGTDPDEVLADIAAMGGSRWRTTSPIDAPTLAALRAALEVAAAERAAGAAPAETTVAVVPVSSELLAEAADNRAAADAAVAAAVDQPPADTVKPKGKPGRKPKPTTTSQEETSQ